MTLFRSNVVFGAVTAVLVLASAPVFADKLNLKVDAFCNDRGIAVFKIHNQGARWPKAGRVEIYDVEDKSIISKRRFRLARGQNATFRVRDAGTEYGRVGLWVSPSWYEREFEYDATVTCE